MRDIESLYPRFIPIVNKFLYEVSKAEIQAVVYCSLRTPEENAEIYPQNPTRWSNHIAGVAVDIWPSGWSLWPRIEFQDRFNNWPYWDKLRSISVDAGIDPPQAFNASDKDHFQCLFGTSGHILQAEYNNFKGNAGQKLANVWQYLDLHGKA